jgi:hypothetical protein
VAPRNFDAFFAKGQKKTVEIPPVPGREGAARFCNSRLQQGDPSFVCRNQAAETKEGKAMGKTAKTKRAIRRAHTSAQQKLKLSFRQHAYMMVDPRWRRHRQKLADVQLARRMTLFPDELRQVVAMRKLGRTFSYIQEEIGVCKDVIRRELQAQGISTARIKRRAKRGKGFWSLMGDDPDATKVVL